MNAVSSEPELSLRVEKIDPLSARNHNRVVSGHTLGVTLPSSAGNVPSQGIKKMNSAVAIRGEATQAIGTKILSAG